jgi:hypothetical protein
MLCSFVFSRIADNGHIQERSSSDKHFVSNGYKTRQTTSIWLAVIFVINSGIFKFMYLLPLLFNKINSNIAWSCPWGSRVIPVYLSYPLPIYVFWFTFHSWMYEKDKKWKRNRYIFSYTRNIRYMFMTSECLCREGTSPSFTRHERKKEHCTCTYTAWINAVDTIEAAAEDVELTHGDASSWTFNKDPSTRIAMNCGNEFCKFQVHLLSLTWSLQWSLVGCMIFQAIIEEIIIGIIWNRKMGAWYSRLECLWTISIIRFLL